MAGSLTNVAETKLLELLFKNSAWGLIGDAAGLQPSSASGYFYVALYTVAPTETTAGTECNYTGYVRIPIARSPSGEFTVSGDNATNTNALTFAQCTGGTNQAVAFGLLTASTGGTLILYGDITDPAGGLAISNGITPIFSGGDLDINMD